MAVITSFSFETLRSCISILLLLVTSVQSDCERGGTCNDTDKLLEDIAADPKSHQQLLQAFYPINRAQPAYMVVAYFLNFTGAFPEQCDGHTYPWTTFPNFNTTHIWWFLWSTLPANNVVNIQLMTEFGLSVPAQSYYALFNTAPWWLEVTTTTACVALPYNVEGPKCKYGQWCTGALVMATAEVRDHNPFGACLHEVLAVYTLTSIATYSVCRSLSFDVELSRAQRYHIHSFLSSADECGVF